MHQLQEYMTYFWLAFWATLIKQPVKNKLPLSLQLLLFFKYTTSSKITEKQNNKSTWLQNETFVGKINLGNYGKIELLSFSSFNLYLSSFPLPFIHSYCQYSVSSQSCALRTLSFIVLYVPIYEHVSCHACKVMRQEEMDKWLDKGIRSVSSSQSVCRVGGMDERAKEIRTCIHGGV